MELFELPHARGSADAFPTKGHNAVAAQDIVGILRIRHHVEELDCEPLEMMREEQLHPLAHRVRVVRDEDRSAAMILNELLLLHRRDVDAPCKAELCDRVTIPDAGKGLGMTIEMRQIARQVERTTLFIGYCADRPDKPGDELLDFDKQLSERSAKFDLNHLELSQMTMVNRRLSARRRPDAIEPRETAVSEQRLKIELPGLREI